MPACCHCFETSLNYIFFIYCALSVGRHSLFCVQYFTQLKLFFFFFFLFCKLFLLFCKKSAESVSTTPISSHTPTPTHTHTQIFAFSQPSNFLIFFSLSAHALVHDTERFFLKYSPPTAKTLLSQKKKRVDNNRDFFLTKVKLGSTGSSMQKNALVCWILKDKSLKS